MSTNFLIAAIMANFLGLWLSTSLSYIAFILLLYLIAIKVGKYNILRIVRFPLLLIFLLPLTEVPDSFRVGSRPTNAVIGEQRK